MAKRSPVGSSKKSGAMDWDYPGTVRFDEVLAAENIAIAERRAARAGDGLERGGAGSRGRTPNIAEKYQVKSFTRFGSAPESEEKVQDTIGLALSGGGIRSAAFCLGALQALDVTGVLNKVDYLSTVSGGGYIGTCMTAAMQFNGGKFPFPSKLQRREAPPIQHIRDTSNYLFPSGPFDLFRNAAIYARGLIANFIIVAFFLFLAAGLTVRINPTPDDLAKPSYLASLLGIVAIGLRVALYSMMFVGLLILIWGVFRSFLRVSKEIGEPEVGVIAWALVVVVAIVLVVAQPVILDELVRQSGPAGVVSNWMARVAPVFAVFATVVGFLSPILGETVKHAFESPSRTSQFKAYLSMAVIWLAAAVVPVLLWMAYLALAYWGITGDGPQVLRTLNDLIASTGISWTNPSAISYFLIAAILLLLSMALRPNSNSLHPLYRDRLSKTFLFQPSDTPLPPDRDLEPALLKLSDLKAQASPYPILNSALNIQDSKIANRRGRNADFFMLTPRYIGSPTTRYVETEKIEDLAPDFNLASAMAISGAAFSSSMGAATIKPLTPTLAILNIRLGYWLRNPIWVIKSRERNVFGRTRNVFANFYFLAELLGLLNESRKSVYLTDGGHIENLGIYELLRRRCHVIIAVDAEADARMAFSSFVKLQQHARIDLGVRIELPWHEINKVSLATRKAMDAGQFEQQQGPHCAIGEIEYPGSQFGILVYIKASLSGDENDYIRYYRQRYPWFPHETTLDQMFSEEQFEVYRALGFHAAFGLFDRRDSFAHLDPKRYPRTDAEIRYLDEIFPQTSDREARRPGQRTTLIEVVQGQSPHD